MTDLAYQLHIEKEVRLGKHPAKDDERMLMLAKYLAPELPPPPTSLIRTHDIEAILGSSDWGMMRNDDLGDCTCAALGHAEQVWAAISKGVRRTPSDPLVEGLYWATGSADDGRYLLDVLNYVRHHYLFHHRVYAFMQVSLANLDLVKQGISLFGLAYIGLGLPVSAQQQRLWDLTTGPDSEPYSWGGHAVILVDYDAQGPTCITWGQKLKMTWEFFHYYCDEAFVLVDSEWFNHSHTPTGLNRQELQADLEAIK